MRAICVEDERLLMEDTLAMCRSLSAISEAEGFTSPKEALLWVQAHPVDIALLDINMPGMNGLELAARIKAISPGTAIIFVTGYSEYAKDAFAVRATGYLMKPVTEDALTQEVLYALSLRTPASIKDNGEIAVKTFGSFDVFLQGKPIKFKIAKCKEILAFLVDRQGGSVTRPEISATLWPDRPYDRKQQKQLDVYIRALKETLAEYGLSRMFEMERGTMRVVPEMFSCDAYRFFAGDPAAVNAYRGEYMSAYPWASLTDGISHGKQRTK